MYKAGKKISLMSFMSFSRPRPKPTCLRQADESNFFALHEQALHLRGFMRSSRVRKYAKFGVFYAKIVQMTP